MFATFFYELKSAKVPVTLKEYLTLMEALQADLADRSVENFYYLSRAALVKDERHLDKFDQVFGHVFKGLELMSEAVEAPSPRNGCASCPSSTCRTRTRPRSRRWAAGTRSWRS
jgi:uncharacterized protein with von Willebrand factor type A (vWA) domain